MGIRDELQTKVAAALDTDLQDAVKNSTGSYIVRGAWGPVAETDTETQVAYLGREVLARYRLRRTDGVNIMHDDVKLTTLVNEATDKPAIGYFIVAPGLITGEFQRYGIITAPTDPTGAAHSTQLRRV